MGKIVKGIWPTMITPFTQENEIDEPAVAALMDWYAAHGCDGVFAVCQSSEMFFLTLEERVRLAGLCVRHAGGRVQVIASGHISDTHEEQLLEIRGIWETGVSAVVLVTNRMAAAKESDSVWIENAQRLLDAFPEVTFGMYECPYPYKRLISEKMLIWMVKSGRIAFLKDTCCHAETIRRRLSIIDQHTPPGAQRMGLYNANTMTLLESLRDGADGFCGVMGNLHPDLYRWLFQNFRAEPGRAADLQAALTLLSGLEAHAYPVCAKQHMQDEKIPMTLVTRSIPQQAFQYAHAETLRQAEKMEALLRRIYLKNQAYSPRWQAPSAADLGWKDGAYPAAHQKPEGMQVKIIHRADEAYPFLHDTMIAEFEGRLLCAWYNCSESEIVGHTVIRGRWSSDHGQTFTAPEVIAALPRESGLHMVPAVFSKEAGGLYAYITEMSAHDRPVGYATYRYRQGAWEKIAHSDTPALFNTQPVSLPNGTLLSAGRISAAPGELPLIPCVMASARTAPTSWEVTRLPGPWVYGCFPLLFPETTLLADGMRITAVTRNDGGPAQVFESRDGGTSWDGPRNARLPIAASKVCGGTLRGGGQYLIYNERTSPPGRSRLVIALRKNADHPFDRVYTLFDGYDPAIEGGPQWHYPCAVQHDDRLFVSCTASKPDERRRHAALAIIPVASLCIDT